MATCSTALLSLCLLTLAGCDGAKPSAADDTGAGGATEAPSDDTGPGDDGAADDGADDTAVETTPDDSASAGDSGDVETVPPALLARFEVDVTEGALPLTVRFDASGAIAEAGVTSLIWDFGDAEPESDTGLDSGDTGGDTGTDTDTTGKKASATGDTGSTAEGPLVTHTYLRSGKWTVTLTLTDAIGQVDVVSAVITVAPPICPTIGESQELGEVTSDDLIEASGVVESRRTPGVLWSHNDAGDDPRLFALSSTGRHLGTWTIDGAPRGDWEDIAASSEGGEAILYVGDIGDNARDNETITVYRVLEPETPDPESGDPVDETVSAEVLTLTYPDGAIYDAESLMVDGPTGDLYIVTKDYDGVAEVFRKPAPHADGDDVTLEHVQSLNFSAAPLFGGATTGATISPAGDQIVIRTYRPTAFLWSRVEAISVAEALSGEPCEVLLEAEEQGESVGFAADGSGLFTISEREYQPVWFVPLSVSD